MIRTPLRPKLFLVKSAKFLALHKGTPLGQTIVSDVVRDRIVLISRLRGSLSAIVLEGAAACW